MTVADDPSAPLDDRVEAALGSRPTARRSLAASTVTVLDLDLADGRRIVAKHADGTGRADLPIERAMLADLARESDLPLPAVLYGCDDLLLLSHIDNDGGAPGAAAQGHAAELLAALHGRRHARFGWHRETVIGQLPQPNPWEESWVAFFRDHRLRHMAEAGRREGTVDARLHDRLEALAGRIERYIAEPAHPALLHGDVWTGNVLTRGDRIVGFIDPAIYVGHPEIELAFATLFDTFGPPFFRRYAELAPFEPDFFELRRDLYNIYPLLVHVRYWSPAYARPIERTLERIGL